MAYLSDTNSNIPETLIKSFFNEGVVAFVGTGPSIDAGLCSWSSLLKLMAKEVETKLSPRETEFINSYIAEERFLIVADFLKSKMTNNQFAQLIESEFLNYKPSKIHKAIVSLPFRGIITTNYDLLLSEADLSKHFRFPFTWQDASILRKVMRSPFLVHAHGIAENPETIILSSSDYDNLRLSEKANQFWESLKNIFLNYRVLFIGYSLNDPDLNLFLTELRYIFRGNLKDQFALIVQHPENRDPLKIHHLQKREIIPIYIYEDASVGETIFKWLNKLKDKLDQRKEKEISPVIRTKKDINAMDTASSQLNPFIESLVKYLSIKYTSHKSAQNILKMIGDTERFSSDQPINECWENFITLQVNKNLKKFRKFISLLSEKDPNEGLLKRILSHLPPKI